MARQRALAALGDRAGGDPFIGRRNHARRTLRRRSSGGNHEIRERRGASSSAPAENHVNPTQPGENGNGGNGLRFREAKEKFVSEWERDYFVRALRSTNGNISRAAEKVGMYRQSFQQKMRELGISVAELGLKAEEE